LIRASLAQRSKIHDVSYTLGEPERLKFES